MNISLFGNIAIDATVRFQSEKIRALLVYLAAHAGQPIPRSQLAPLLWGGFPDKSAKNSLRNSFSRLRKALTPITSQFEEPVLVITRSTAQINPVENLYIDVYHFEQLWTKCKQIDQVQWGERGQIINRLNRMVDLYRGPFLDNFALQDSIEFDMWVTMQRERYHQRALIALDTLTRYHQTSGRWDKVQSYASQQLELEPWREVAHRELMQALHQMGRRDAALAQFERCRTVLAEELAAEPSSTTIALFESIRDETGPKMRGHSAETQIIAQPIKRHNLPQQLTPLIGRDSEQLQLQLLLNKRTYRLITLLGQGGVGKTRLALAAAKEQLHLFAQGVYFVSLAETDTMNGMIAAITSALGIMLIGPTEPLTQLKRYLQKRETLLVLDNLEHLLSDDAIVEILLELLHAAPNIIILVTSQQRLWVRAETLIALEGLSHAHDERQKRLAKNDWRQFEALRLFVERRQRVDAQYTPTHDLDAIIEICALVHGLPLGVELAATQSSITSCTEVAAALAAGMRSLRTRFRDLPQRQRSLEAVFTYSWGLLSAKEQDVLAMLSIFRGGFDREAVQAIMPAATDTVLHTLIGHSLLRKLSAENRYELLEMIRQFAATRLDQTAQVKLQADYATIYLQRLAEQQQALDGHAPHLVAAMLQPDLHNIRNAWEYAVATHNFKLLCNAEQALSSLLLLRGMHHMGRDLFQQAVAATEQHQTADAAALLPHLLTQTARFHMRLSQFNSAAALAQTAIDHATRAEDAWSIGDATNVLAESMWRTANYSAALATLQQGEWVMLASKSQRLLGSFHYNLGFTHQFMGAYEQAEHHLQEALKIWQATDHVRFEAVTHNGLGVTHYNAQQFRTAEQHYHHSLALHTRIQNQHEIAQIRTNLAGVQSGFGHHQQAINLLKQALSYYQHSGSIAQLGWVLNNLAYGYLLIEQYELADQHLQQAVVSAEQCGEQLLLIFALGNLGQVAMKRNLSEQAVTYFHQSLAVAEAYEGFFDTSNIRAHLARLTAENL